jgi:hypothetical protein
MKILALQPAVTGITTLLASAGYTISPSPELAQGWLIIGGLSLLTTISGIVANIAVWRRSKEAVRVATPLIVEMKKEFATWGDLESQRKFTDEVRKELGELRNHMEATLKEETRQLCTRLSPVEKALCALERDAARNREDICEINRRLTP